MTITPAPWRSITGTTCFAVQNTLFTFTSITRLHTASLKSVTLPCAQTPALQWIPSMRPCSSSARATSACTLASLETSVNTKSAVCPAARSLRSSAAPGAAWVEAMTTRAPSAAKCRLHASPMPEVPPVTMRTLS